MKLIIFDLDGTLVDSLKQVHQSVCAVFAKEGITPPTFIQHSMEFNYPWIDGFRKFGIKMEEKEIRKIFERELKRNQSFELFSDVIDYIVYCCRKGYQMAVVSSNDEDRVRQILAYHGLLPHFQFVSGGNGNKTQMFLRTCRELYTHPQDAVVVGDTFGDMLDAKEAGIRPIGIIRYPELQSSHDFRLRMREAGARDVVTTLSRVY